LLLLVLCLTNLDLTIMYTFNSLKVSVLFDGELSCKSYKLVCFTLLIHLLHRNLREIWAKKSENLKIYVRVYLSVTSQNKELTWILNTIKIACQVTKFICENLLHKKKIWASLWL
jgi:hypothetical protein